MAAVQGIRKRMRRAGAPDLSEATRDLLEDSVHGYNVVPAAVHLTAATLSMAETRQMIHDMPICLMPHGVVRGVARLGTLDFLPGAPGHTGVQQAYMFQELLPPPERTDGSGERHREAQFPRADLFLSNPPYTRAGGPGDAADTTWNPLFGSLLSEDDAAPMRRALVGALRGTAASAYAGLGSAFLVLAAQRLEAGARFAFVLPATLLTGSRWAAIRGLLLQSFRIEWVVVSHDERHKAHRATLPGRLWVSFSEPTRIADVLIVGTKVGSSDDSDGWSRFVNLRRNPDQPTEAMAVVRALLAVEDPAKPCSEEIRIGDSPWGEMEIVRQAGLTATRWTMAPSCKDGSRVRQSIWPGAASCGTVRSIWAYLYEGSGRSAISVLMKCRSRTPAKACSKSPRRTILAVPAIRPYEPVEKVQRAAKCAVQALECPRNDCKLAPRGLKSSCWGCVNAQCGLPTLPVKLFQRAPN